MRVTSEEKLFSEHFSLLVSPNTYYLVILYIIAIVYLTTMMGNMSDEIKATKLPSALVIFGII